MKTDLARTPLDVIFAVPGLPFNGETFEKQSLGGSESAAYYMARALAKRGHRVSVFCNTEQRVRCADVDYIPLGIFRQYIAFSTHDVCIVERLPELFSAHCRARYSVLWCHDLAMGRQEGIVRGTAWNYDKVFVLSEFMRAQYKKVYNLPDELLFQTRNGVDLECVQRVREGLPNNITRNPLSLVYSARPERGLDVLLTEIMPRILKYEPQARLFLSAYHNPVSELADFYAQGDAWATRLGDRVVKLGALNKQQLYEVYHACGVYVYPVPSVLAPDFDEISPVHGDTLIETLSGAKPIRELKGRSGFHVYSRRADGSVGISKVKGVWHTRHNAKVITLRLRPGMGCQANKETTLTLTPDHEVMLRDGSYRQAGRLMVGDRVVACKVSSPKNYPTNYYAKICMTGKRGRDAQRIVIETVLGRSLRRDEVVHHRDGNGFNNEPDNLEVTNQSDHLKKHWREKTPEQLLLENAQRSKTSKKIWSTLEGRRSRSRAGKATWAKINSLSPEDRQAWCQWRESRKKNHGTADKSILSANGSNARRKMWSRIKSLSKKEQEAWFAGRTRKMREGRWGGRVPVGENHVVITIEAAPRADVFCMEVEPDHNFVANGIVVHNCLSAMEAQACGLPIVTSARGALPETVAPGAGVLIPDTVHTPEYYDAFANAVLRLMRSPEEWRVASAAGLERAQTLSWDLVAEQWEELFEREIREKNNDLATLANHFWRHSDIYAAKECLRRLPLNDTKSAAVRERVEKDWAFLEEPDGFRQQYERIGATHDAAVLEWAPREPRYATLKQWLQQRPAEVKTVLDYGCAHGAYAVNLLKELPELQVTGVDIDQHGIEMAYGFAEKLGVSARWRGVVGGHDRLIDPEVPEMTELYDVAVAQEVLEHVADPGLLLASLEQRVRDGGYVYLTVPFGPWEYSDYRRYPYRAHLWEFDLQDLHDLLDAAKGKEAEVTTFAMSYGMSPETDEPLGWWCIQYRVTPTTRGKVGKINMERKLWLQRPRQTVSAAIIAGPNCEENLHWCLRSLLHVADEVVVVDCGLSTEAKRILDTYAWGIHDTTTMREGPRASFLSLKVVPGVDPKTQGFETPRNMGLEYCTQDWVLWIDTDEKLLQPYCLHKYLRSSIFQGYSIKQHHFAVDTAFDADMPVRLFRNNGKLRWYGMIHEHPETELNKGPGHTIVIADVHIPHVGYLIESGRQQRFTRNLPMLQADIAKYPDRILQKHFIMRDHILLCTYELRHNGGKVTDEIRNRAREVVNLYRQYFLGKGHMANVDPITYYSQALTLLGEGFDAWRQVAADKIDAKPNGGLKARFASVDDFMAEVTRRSREATQRFDNRYW